MIGMAGQKMHVIRANRTRPHILRGASKARARSVGKELELVMDENTKS